MHALTEVKLNLHKKKSKFALKEPHLPLSIHSDLLWVSIFLTIVIFSSATNPLRVIFTYPFSSPLFTNAPMLPALPRIYTQQNLNKFSKEANKGANPKKARVWNLRLSGEAKGNGTDEGALARAIGTDDEVETRGGAADEVIVCHEVVDLDLNDVSG